MYLMKKIGSENSVKYVEHGVGFLLPNLESFSNELEKLKEYIPGDMRDDYNATNDFVSGAISSLKNMGVRSLEYKVKTLDGIWEKFPAYIMKLGHFQSLHPHKN